MVMEAFVKHISNMQENTNAVVLKTSRDVML